MGEFVAQAQCVASGRIVRMDTSSSTVDLEHDVALRHFDYKQHVLVLLSSSAK
jgi:hypothetical protein